MNWRAIWTLVGKDLKVIRQSRMVMMPMILLPLIMLVIVPGIIVVAASSVDPTSLSAQVSQFDAFLKNMPPGLQAEMQGLNERQVLIALLTTYFVAPLYLIVPMMVASVIAADSFAGEKERKTLEALIYTPITDAELFLAKVLTALIPAILVAVGGFVLYGLVVNIGGWSVMGRIFFPNIMWLILVIWVAPAAAGLGLGTSVIASSKVKTFQEAYQTGALVVLPIVLLVVGQATGLMYFSVTVALTLGLVLWGIDAALLRYGVKSFQRGEIIARL